LYISGGTFVDVGGIGVGNIGTIVVIKVSVALIVGLFATVIVSDGVFLLAIGDILF